MVREPYVCGPNSRGSRFESELVQNKRKKRIVGCKISTCNLRKILGWKVGLSVLGDGVDHGLINYKDTKAKCRHLKNWPVKGLHGRCFLEFIDTVSHVRIFDSALWTIALAPLTFSLVYLPTFPLACVKVQFKQTVSGWGCWVLFETIFCRSLTLCVCPDPEPTKLLDHPKQKTRRGGGARDRLIPAAKFLYR